MASRKKQGAYDYKNNKHTWKSKPQYKSFQAKQPTYYVNPSQYSYNGTAYIRAY